MPLYKLTESQAHALRTVALEQARSRKGWQGSVGEELDLKQAADRLLEPIWDYTR